MIARTSSRLPGLRFESQPPPIVDALPRMDVAMFVGFAACGPIDRPVPVEDVAQFTEIFGPDLPLVRDMQSGDTVYAYLGATVRSFFNNGGKRCWVVRVAGENAQYNYFPVSGMLRIDESGTISPAFARARSEGSWSDSLRVSAVLNSQRVYVHSTTLSPNSLTLSLMATSSNAITIGDLLRLTFDGYTLMLPVRQKIVTIQTDSNGHRTSQVEIPYQQAYWFKQPVPQLATQPDTSSPSQTQQAQENSSDVSEPSEQATHMVLYTHQGPQTPLSVYQFNVKGDGTVACVLQVPFSQAPQPGMLVSIERADGPLWMIVQQLQEVQNVQNVQEMPANETDVQQTQQVHVPSLLVQGQGLQYLQDTPVLKSDTPLFVETLSFALSAYTGDGLSQTLSDLTFAQEQSRFWAALPTDQQLYEDTTSPAGNEPTILSQAMTNTPYSVLWNAAINPRFPLAGDGTLSSLPGVEAIVTGTNIYLPIAMPAAPDYLMECYPIPNAHQQPRLTRNGLDNFGAALFLDSDMVSFGVSDIIEQSDLLHYGGPMTHHLKGIYNALGIDEVSIIAVPDAIHRGWIQASEGKQGTVQPQSSVQTPQISRISQALQTDGKQSSLVDKEAKGARHRSLFQQYNPITIEPPELYVVVAPDIDSTFTLGWSQSPFEGAKYRLEEARSPDMHGAVPVYIGSGEQLTIFGRSDGDFYYRIRVEWKTDNGIAIISAWSDIRNVCPSQAQHWQLKAIGDYRAYDLLAVQRGLIRVCAARGDLFAVLSLPEHYSVAEAVAHVTALKSSNALQISMPVEETALLPPIQFQAMKSKFTAIAGQSTHAAYTIFPFAANEKGAWSYAALYYPWLYVLNENATVSERPVPPDGGACGILARRTLARGVWIAPANEPLSDTVALTEQVLRPQWQVLQESQVNLFLQERQSFLSLSADTLSEPTDADLRPISVRRLLSLLRRLTLQLGATYVFEPNSRAFQRSVQVGFEAMLQDMFMRGAFAGNTPATSYRVVADSSINTQQSMEQGRFIVAIQVAPSYPLKFLTIRLVQSGLSGTVLEVVA